MMKYEISLWKVKKKTIRMWSATNFNITNWLGTLTTCISTGWSGSWMVVQVTAFLWGSPSPGLYSPSIHSIVSNDSAVKDLIRLHICADWSGLSLCICPKTSFRLAQHISFRRPACSRTKHPLRKNPVEKMGCQIARMFWSLTTIVY